VVLGEEPAVVIETEQGGKAAEAVQDTRRVRPPEQWGHARQALLVEIEVQASIAVSEFAHDWARSLCRPGMAAARSLPGYETMSADGSRAAVPGGGWRGKG